MFGVGVHWASHNQDSYTLIENLSDDGIAQLYVTKFSTISLNLTKLYITHHICHIKRNPKKMF